MKTVLFSNLTTNKEFFAAKKRIKSGYIPDLRTTGMKIDSQGRDVVVDYKSVIEEIRREKEASALAWHKNNPHIRFSNCGFPHNRENRDFALAHDFGDYLKTAKLGLKNKSFVFINGPPRVGKTSLAIRVAWEEMKLKPLLRPSFLSINAWVASQMPNQNMEPLSGLRNFIIVDDFDKFSFRSEFQTLVVLRLIDKLIDDSHQAVFTSNISLADALKKAESFSDLTVVFERLKERSIEVTVRR